MAALPSTEAVRRFKEPKSIVFGFLLGSSLAVLVWFAGVQVFDWSPNQDSQYSEQPNESSSSAISTSRELEVLEDFELSFPGIASLYKAISVKNKNGLADWLDKSLDFERSDHRHAIQAAILERLAELDPEEAFQRAQSLPRQDQAGAIESVLRVWSISDLDAAVKAATKLDQLLKPTALLTILETRTELTEDVQLELATQLDGDHLVPQLKAERIALEMGENPEQAWNAIVNDGGSLISRASLLADLARDWRLQDDQEIIRKIVESVDPGVNVWSSEKYVLLRYIVKMLAKSNPHEIFEQTSKLSNPSSAALLHAIAEEWALSDHAAAFAAVSNHEQEFGYTKLTSTVARVWARKNPQEILDAMDSYFEDSKLIGIEQAVLAISQKDPHEAIKLLENLADEGVKTSMIEVSFLMDWSKRDAKSALDWVLPNMENPDPAAMNKLQVVLENLVAVDPELAMNIALQHPAETGRSGLDAAVLRALIRIDVDSTLSLLPDVSTQSKTMTVPYLAAHLTSNGRPQRALELAIHLPDSQRAALYDSVIKTWVLTNPIELMRVLEDLPTPAVSKMAASQLVQGHESNPLLSQDQLDLVKSFLNGD